MTRIEAIALALAAFTLISSADAALAQEDYSRTGPYLGIEGSVGVPRQLEDSVEFGFTEAAPAGGALEGLDVDPSLGIHARAGWRLHPRFGGEVHFEYLDEFNISAGDGQRAFPSSSGDLGSVSSWTLTGDLNAYLLTGRIQPFLSVGAGVMNVDTKDRRESGISDRVALGFPGDGTEFALRMGGGIDWYLNEYVAFSLNSTYVLPTGSLKDYDYFSVGFGLRIPFWWLMPGGESGEDVAAATRQSAPGSPPTERFAGAAELFDEPYYWPARARRRPEPIQIAALDDWQMVVDERSEATDWLLAEEPVTVPVTVLAQQSATEEERAPDPGPPLTEIEAVEPEIGVDVEEILVTGEKSQGFLASDAAMSQVVFSPEDLTAERITDISDLAEYTPNLEINKGFAASGATIFIRGIGLNDYNANASSSGAVYVDEVYMNSPVGQLFQFFDTQGVEVLRGPQGSLFGRNATAGAILISSRVPDGTLNAYSSFTYGNFNTIEGEGALGVPIVSDVLSGRFAFRYASRDGITKNRCGTNPNGDTATEGIAGQCSRGRREFFSGPVPKGLPKEVNEVEVWAARGILRFEPNPDQEWILNVHGGQNRGDAAQLQNRGSKVRGLAINGTGEDDLGYRDLDRYPFAGDYDVIEPEYLDLFGTNLRGEIEIGDLSLTSISGFESNERSIFDNTDASPHVLIHSDLEDEAWQASQELRLNSYLGEDFNWTAGAYFLYEELEADNSFNTRDVNLNRQVYDQQLVTWAAYGNFTYQLMDRPCGPVLCWFELEGGVRYNWEQKTFDITATSGPINGSIVNQIAQSETEIWDAVTGDAILRWRFFEDASIYAKYTRGFKGGHFNGGAFLSAQVVEAVDPESVDSYEIGVKSSWADGQLTFSLAAFYYDYENYQVFTLQNNIGALPLPQLLNAPRVESKGIEVELGVTPTEGLDIDLSFSLLDAEFTDFKVIRSFLTPPCNGRICSVEFKTQDFTGNDLPGATPVQFTARASYELLLGRYGTLVPRVSANYKGRTYFDAGDVRGREPIPNEGASQDPYWLFNAGLEYRTPDGHFTVSGWVRNITDQVYLQNSFDLREGYGMLLDFYGDPRTYGITVGVEF